MEEEHGPQPCLFCAIASKKIPSNIVYEDDSILAFLDINPLTEGHTLVVPKKHIVNIFDIPEEELARVMNVAQKIVKNMKDSGHAEGVDMTQASGEAADQAVPHFHLHIIPRKAGDGLDMREWWLSRAKKTEPEKLAQVAAKLKIQTRKTVVEDVVEEAKEELERGDEESEWTHREIDVA